MPEPMQTNPVHAASVPPVPLPAAPLIRPEHLEDSVTRVLEQQAAKIPSGLFLAASLLMTGASWLFELRGRPVITRMSADAGSALLICGLYTKLVKTLGSR
jgi:hypothetical protein